MTRRGRPPKYGEKRYAIEIGFPRSLVSPKGGKIRKRAKKEHVSIAEWVIRTCKKALE